MNTENKDDNNQQKKKLIINLLSLLGSTKEEVLQKLQILGVQRDQETRCPIASYLSQNGVGKGANIWVYAWEGYQFKHRIMPWITLNINNEHTNFSIKELPQLKGIYDFISALSYRNIETAISMSN
jgi:hypothetical protein